ncbi:GNAT family N-acetyltransferase [Zymomonas mobilis]|uniref:N-acetyltransferase domain-containing protein n=1 Tax=Zymomonas mobilis subsp. pomaceae (strain ATCC 29192 / DSM 22645 / JCM 10191 / CCUG 17912 / NBRC 13757 / NCIMB 11200 / NRRL B-4491 / Barker I) TaxID=579138 RepID=F8EWE4_ZYMMT|nr:GNAT family N-acetyltransferase [Zymomonas mobilis]AEI38554.1 conserved hypothetical protein [Zymomonas mobilis subsp. pomaceae ATCC 29192]MDX5948244.1 GNAT family N-acetyltransferase [Zymomonas mobilis subsp. pomaceae]GEB88999.1 hypothetical protein ZMO02_06360 [Zymomonas mobilis subsp. pomaceae]
MADLKIYPIGTTQSRNLNRFIEVAYELNRHNENWIAPLRSELREQLNSQKNPWFEHAEAEYFLAERDGKLVGRISAHIEKLTQKTPPEQGGGVDVGMWGMFEATDQEVADALLKTAENWHRNRGIKKIVGPISLSIWEEPGLLIKGHDHPPTIMMGHQRADYRAWIEAEGHKGIKDLFTYELDITKPFPPLIQKIVASGEKNARIKIRKVNKNNFMKEARLLMDILNDAWSKNWGYVPLTDKEIEHARHNLEPIVFEDLIMVAEVDGEPAAFMMTLPDVNEKLAEFKGKLFPFNWIKMLWWLRKPRVRTMRVPLMGVRKKFQTSRIASQVAFMMIEYIRRNSVANYGASRGEIGWILDDNQGMRSIATAIHSDINRIYRIYSKNI